MLERDIPEVLIGNGNKRVHYNGSFHANEWITTPVIMTFLNDYLLAITNQADIRGLDMFPFYQQTMLSIVPMVNPDGVELVLKGHWRRPGFTVELGKGTNPLPISQFDEIFQKSLGIFLAGLYM
ncbi:murein tripeptide amidase MpaA [Peribacillus frigoritolerans]|nr:murein tripeptide amidase MpaA [Peribacillus frigoritolerans]